MTRDVERTGLEAALREGFALARRPSSLDEIGDTSERQGFANLVGKHWSEVPAEVVYTLRWDLRSFTRAGWRHYLPAFLLAALSSREVAENVVDFLGQWSSDRDALWPAEKRAVRTWLHHLRGVQGDDQAAATLADYWDAPPIAERDERRELLARRTLAVFPCDRAAPWLEQDFGRLRDLSVRDPASLTTDEVVRQLPAHLWSWLEGGSSSILWLLELREQRDGHTRATRTAALVEAVAKQLTRAQRVLVADAFAAVALLGGPPDAKLAEDDWRQLADATAPSGAEATGR